MDKTTESEIHTPFSSHKSTHTVNDTINTTRIGIERDADKYIDSVASLKAYCIICQSNKAGNCKNCPRKQMVEDVMSQFQGLDLTRIEAETYKKVVTYMGPTTGIVHEHKGLTFLKYYGMILLGLIGVLIPFALIVMLL